MQKRWLVFITGQRFPFLLQKSTHIDTLVNLSFCFCIYLCFIYF